MNQPQPNSHRPSTTDTRHYDYSNRGRPRDFDIRIEVAEQQEVIKQSLEQYRSNRWQCSEYGF
jgi:hypothetical protein